MICWVEKGSVAWRDGSQGRGMQQCLEGKVVGFMQQCPGGEVGAIAVQYNLWCQQGDTVVVEPAPVFP